VGGKGFGITWKLVQCVVKPREVVSVFGKCHIKLSADEMQKLDSQKVDDETVMEDVLTKSAVSTTAEDSDEDEPVPVPVPAPAPVEEVAVKKPAKKVVVKKPTS
jgi:hypothetical protein